MLIIDKNFIWIFFSNRNSRRWKTKLMPFYCINLKILKYQFQLYLAHQLNKSNPFHRKTPKTAPAKVQWLYCYKCKETWTVFKVNSSSCRYGIIQQWKLKTKNKFKHSFKHLSTKTEIISLFGGLLIWISRNIYLMLKPFFPKSFIFITLNQLLKKFS